MATEKEMELAKQILAKLTAMEKRVDNIEGDLEELNGKGTSTSVDSKLDDLKNVHRGLQATFEQGFADVHKGLDEIREVTTSRGKGQKQKQKGQLN